jgi:HD-like signal output (HDOD) protein
MIMFWNIFKKKTPHKIDSNVNSIPSYVDTNITTNIATLKNINLPVSFLQRLLPISRLLTSDEIQQLHVTSTSYKPGSIVFNRGTEVESLIYLVSGNIYMEANNGSGLEKGANTFKALYPLCTDKLHDFTAIARSNVTVIHLPKSILQPPQHPIVPIGNELNIPNNLRNNPFFIRFYQHFMQGDLKTPNFPDIAIQLRKTIQQNRNIEDIVKIVNMDPVISAKLIQVVNSPVYKPLNPISNCFDAINRLGLTTTRNLATSFSMNNLIKGQSPLTKKLMQQSWLQSIKVSSISYTLAQLTKKVDPDEALLAGLIHNIGALPIITFSDSLPSGTCQQSDIEICVNELQGQMGSIILEKWEFPDSLKHIPILSTDWFTSTSKELDLNDIVILAKYHNLLASTDNASLPLITTLPAFQKLHNQPLSPKMSLQLLHDARQQITETMSFFSH